MFICNNKTHSKTLLSERIGLVVPRLNKVHEISRQIFKGFEEDPYFNGILVDHWGPINPLSYCGGRCCS